MTTFDEFAARFDIPHRPVAPFESPTRLPAHIETVVWTSVTELPEGTHPGDIADCVCGLVDYEEFRRHEALIEAEIERIVGMA